MYDATWTQSSETCNQKIPVTIILQKSYTSAVQFMQRQNSFEHEGVLKCLYVKNCHGGAIVIAERLPQMTLSQWIDRGEKKIWKIKNATVCNPIRAKQTSRTCIGVSKDFKRLFRNLLDTLRYIHDIKGSYHANLENGMRISEDNKIKLCLFTEFIDSEKVRCMRHNLHSVSDFVNQVVMRRSAELPKPQIIPSSIKCFYGLVRRLPPLDINLEEFREKARYIYFAPFVWSWPTVYRWIRNVFDLYKMNPDAYKQAIGNDQVLGKVNVDTNRHPNNRNKPIKTYNFVIYNKTSTVNTPPVEGVPDVRTYMLRTCCSLPPPPPPLFSVVPPKIPLLWNWHQRAYTGSSLLFNVLEYNNNINTIFGSTMSILIFFRHVIEHYSPPQKSGNYSEGGDKFATKAILRVFPDVIPHLYNYITEACHEKARNVSGFKYHEFMVRGANSLLARVLEEA